MEYQRLADGTTIEFGDPAAFAEDGRIHALVKAADGRRAWIHADAEEALMLGQKFIDAAVATLGAEPVYEDQERTV